MKRLVRLFIVSLLIFTSFTYIQQPHTKAATGEKFKILEVRDAWSTTNRIDPGTAVTSMLTGLDASQYDIKMMTVKELNASRFPLDGAFDAIVFDESMFTGTNRYSTTISKKTDNHNTNSIENDITKLKASEITDAYIKKGLPVFLHADVFTDVSSNFSTVFNPSIISGRAVKYTDKKDVISAIQSKKNNRPRLSNVSVSQGGVSLMNINKNAMATPNKSIDFTFNISNIDSQKLNASLYIDFDSNDQFDESEKVIPWAYEMTDTLGKISYTFDAPSYTGPRNWMIRISNSDGLNDYKTGSFLIKDQPAKAKILQIIKTTGVGEIPKFMAGNEYLKKDDDYEFQVKTVLSSDFKPTNKSLDEYDMLIFGFQDSYGGASISNEAFNEVKRFTDTKQGLMLTHDTIFRPNQSDNMELEWEKKFKELAGQKNFTNMGYGAPRTSTKAIKQNAGVMTMYPFTLNDEINIDTTHNQYFGLDLEQPDLIPWYNIKDIWADTENARTFGDARNHYYMYTKGNITYSGAGHTFSGEAFTNDSEKMLFSNTMYRAFIGANHKPLIKNLLPETGDVYSENEPLTISYLMNDFDLRDRELKTRIYIDNELVYQNNSVQNNTLVSKSFESKLNGKSAVTIRVQAEDSRGATVEETRTITVLPSEQFTLSRSIDPVSISKGDTATIIYKIVPNILLQANYAGTTGQKNDWSSLTLENIKFSEHLPSNLQILSVGGLREMSTVGQKVSGSLANLQYSDKLKKGEWRPNIPEITFTVKVKALEDKGIHVLEKKNNSVTSRKTIIRNDMNGNVKEKIIENKSQAFRSLNYMLQEPFATAANISAVEINLNTPKYKVLPEIAPTGSRHGLLKWSIADSSIANIDQEGVIEPKKIGTTDIKLIVPVANGKELVTTSKLTVNDVFDGLTVKNIPDVIYVGQTKTMTGDSTMLSGAKAPVKWIITNPSAVDSTGDNTNTLTLKGMNPGILTVQAAVPATAGSTTYLAQSQVYSIEVKLPELSVNPTNIELWAGTTQNVTASFTPDLRLPFILSKVSDAIELTKTDMGYTVKGIKGTPDGPVEAVLRLSDFSDTQAVTKIRVRENPLTLTASDLTMTLRDDQKRPLLSWSPVTTTERFYRLEVLQGKEYVKTDLTAQTLKALRPGVARVKVTVLKENKEVLEVIKEGTTEKQPLTTTFKVTISSEGSTTESDTDVY